DKCNKNFVSQPNHKGGVINSPNTGRSYQSGIICQYEFEASGQERIQLKITKLDLHYSAGDPNDPYGSMKWQHLRCENQDSLTVFVYIDSKEVELGEFCGRKFPPQLMSPGPRMKVIFKSESTPKDNNSGFELAYSFRTDYGVEGNGQQDERHVCTFQFHSALHSQGFFTSPNYGGHYPRNTECHYIFYGKKNERVVVEFSHFDVDGIIPRCDTKTDSDYVSFSNFLNSVDRAMPRYCGSRPAYEPIKSDAAFFRVTFESNDQYDANGFKANFEFVRDEDETDRYKTPSPSPWITQNPPNSVPAQSVSRFNFAIIALVFVLQSVIFS
ncbi:hypothetical protein DPMN_045715, partial [Dreissena polymorpha]